MSRQHIVGAKVIVALLFGALLGYAMGVSVRAEAERGKDLTLKQYVAGFDRYKAKLENGDMPMAGALVAGVIMVAGMFGVYELFAFGLGKALARLTRRSADPPVRSAPPPWGLDRPTTESGWRRDP